MTAAPRSWVPWLAASLMLGTVAAGLLLDAGGTELGVPHPPFVARWDPRLHAIAAVAVPLFAAAVALGPMLVSPRVSPAGFALAGFGLTLTLRLALAAGRGGTGAWDRVFDLERSREAPNEYLAALGALRHGSGFFLDRFAELVPSLPVHVAGHPPGLMLAIGDLGIDTPGRLAAFCVIAGALSAPLTYGLARELVDERAARVAALLVGFAPGALQYGATSADALYLALGLPAAWLLVAGRPVLGALALAFASFFAWSLLAVAAWAVLAVRGREAAVAAAACTAAVVALHAAVAALSGWDPIGALRATEDVYRLGIASSRPYAFWALGSPVAFLVSLGLPVAWTAARALGRGGRLAIAIWAVLLTAAALGFTKGEAERIWLFFAPYVCLAAAPLLGDRMLRPVLALLAAQALVAEALFGTPW